jgi:hypothetical protein
MNIYEEPQQWNTLPVWFWLIVCALSVGACAWIEYRARK